MFNVTQLPSGLRVATAPMPHMESVAVGLWIGVGGRYEPAGLSGVSHFIEHLLFKGTGQRTAKQISEAVEGIGGYLNAFTGEETTCYYAKASHRHLDTLLDVLTDMYRHSRFAPADIAKERSVIKEEILLYRDQPDHYVHELLTETLWPDQPLGRSLTGTPATLDAINRQALLDYRHTRYLTANTLIAVAGHCAHDDIVARAGRFFPSCATGRLPRFLPARERQRGPRIRHFQKDVEQTHVAIGIRGYSRQDPRRFALKLLSVILGENMSSRLFQVVREQHGLAYAIQSATSCFADTGLLLVSAGLETRRTPQALRMIARELKRIVDRPPAEPELRRAKDYAIGQMRLGLESSVNQMLWVGEHLLAYGRIHTPEQIERELEAVTTDAVQAVAGDLFRARRLNVAVITPEEDDRHIRHSLAF